MTPDPIFRKIFDFGYGSGKKTQNPAGFDSTPPLQIRGHLCFLYRIRSVGWRYRHLGVTAAPGVTSDRRAIFSAAQVKDAVDA